MNEDTLRRIQSITDALDCDIRITQLLLSAAIAQIPDRQRLLRQFAREVENFSASAPPDLNPEYLVEFRARARHMLRHVLGYREN